MSTPEIWLCNIRKTVAYDKLEYKKWTWCTFRVEGGFLKLNVESMTLVMLQLISYYEKCMNPEEKELECA